MVKSGSLEEKRHKLAAGSASLLASGSVVTVSPPNGARRQRVTAGVRERCNCKPSEWGSEAARHCRRQGAL